MVASKQGGRAERERLRKQRERENERFRQNVMRQNQREQREAEKAERDRERAEKQAAQERALLYIQQQQAEAASRTRAVQERVDVLSTVLTDMPADASSASFADLRRTFDPAPFEPPAPLTHPTAPPRWEEYEPPAPAGFGKMFRSGYDQKVAQAQIAFAAAQATHAAHENARQSALSDAQTKHNRAEEQRQQAVEDHNAELEEFEQLVRGGEAPEVEKYVRMLLDCVPQLEGLPHEVDVAYLPEARRLLITRELPGFEVIPAEREFNYVKVRDEIASKPRPDKEIRQRYADLVAQLTLRAMRDAFRIEPAEIIDEVMVNGHVSTRNKATGRPEHPCLVSVSAGRGDFSELVLDQLDAATCLKHLDAMVSNNPLELVAVEPVFDPDLSRYRIIDSHDAVAGLDARVVLTEMDPFKFERLVRDLFEAMGMRSWNTRGSQDDGIDAVAVNPDPIMGGKCIIQAKRYSRVVPVEAVRALAGNVDDARASRGIVVTTAWFGKASRDFVARNPRLQLIEGQELLHLLKKHLNVDALLGVKRPLRRGA
jgi:restriction system protein